MNNNRLSTNSNNYEGNITEIKDLDSKINHLLANSNLEVHENGAR